MTTTAPPAEPTNIRAWPSAHLEVVIARQRRFAEQLQWAGIDPCDTLALVTRLEGRLAKLRATKVA